MTNRREPEQGSPTTALLTLNFSLARYHFSLAKTYLSLSLSVFFFPLCCFDLGVFEHCIIFTCSGQL